MKLRTRIVTNESMPLSLFDSSSKIPTLNRSILEGTSIVKSGASSAIFLTIRTLNSGKSKSGGTWDPPSTYDK